MVFVLSLFWHMLIMDLQFLRRFQEIVLYFWLQYPKASRLHHTTKRNLRSPWRWVSALLDKRLHRNNCATSERLSNSVSECECSAFQRISCYSIAGATLLDEKINCRYQTCTEKNELEYKSRSGRKCTIDCCIGLRSRVLYLTATLVRKVCKFLPLFYNVSINLH